MFGGHRGYRCALPNVMQAIAHAGRTVPDPVAFEAGRTPWTTARLTRFRGARCSVASAPQPSPPRPAASKPRPTSRTIKMVVPYPAGGITDVLPRVMQERL